MNNIKTYSFVKHNSFKFGVVCFLDNDDTVLVACFLKNGFKFVLSDCDWFSVDCLKLLDKKEISKEMISVLKRIKEINFYYDTETYFNFPFLWHITPKEIQMLFNSELSINSLIEKYDDVEVYR